MNKTTDWYTESNGYTYQSIKYNPNTQKTDYRYVYGSVLNISYRQFAEELIGGAKHTYMLKIEASGYENLEIELKVVARSAKDLIVRVFESEDSAKFGAKPLYQKVITEAEILTMPQHQAYYTMYCGMVGLGASRAEGVYFKDLLSLALAGSGYSFASGDSVKFRVTDELYDANYNKKQKSAYDLAQGDLTKIQQNAWYEKTHTYDIIFAQRYFFPGIFEGWQQMIADGKVNNITDGSSYDYSALLKEPKSVAGAVKVEPMLAVKSSERILDRSMAGSEQFPNTGGSLAELEKMNMNRNDGYRFAMGQLIATENGKHVISSEATRFMVTYNIFGIDIIKGENSDNISDGKFTDVPNNHWAAQYINAMVNKGILNGKTANVFAPNDPITRAEFAAILSRMSGEELPVGNSIFGDVSANAWYAENVAWAVNAGITNGVSEKNFAPNDKITRQEMVVMIMRYTEHMNKTLKLQNEPIVFADNAKIAVYAKDAVNALQQAGVIGGKGNNIFAPADNATRAEAAKMLGVLETAFNG